MRASPSLSVWQLLLLVGCNGYLARSPAHTRTSVARIMAAPRTTASPVCLLPGLTRLGGPRVWKLDSRSAFERELASAKNDKCLMLVKFSQPRCKSCKAMGIKIDRLVRKRPQHRFFDVDITTAEGKAIARRVGNITGVPTVSAYADGELVFSKPLPVRLLPELEEVINVYGESLSAGKHDGPQPTEQQQKEHGAP